MLVTLITDASFSFELRRGAWAFRVKCDRGEFWGSDLIKPKINNSTVAELCAVAKGVHHSFVRGYIEPGDKVIVRIDNLSALNRLAGTMKKSSMKDPDLTIAKQATKIVHRYRDEHGIEFDFRHIKGHSGTHSPDRFIHNKVDKRAGEHIKKLWRVHKDGLANNGQGSETS